MPGKRRWCPTAPTISSTRRRAEGGAAKRNQRRTIMNRTQWMKSFTVATATVLMAGFAMAGTILGVPPPPPQQNPPFDFEMAVSAGAARCVPDATGNVSVTSLGSVEQMDVDISGLPANTEFDFF